MLPRTWRERVWTDARPRAGLLVELQNGETFAKLRNTRPRAVAGPDSTDGIIDLEAMLSAIHNLALISVGVLGAAACWLKYLAGPRRYLAVLPSNVRPNLFAGD
jgi:hypothetical protein